jgi:hypothetical protein
MLLPQSVLNRFPRWNRAGAAMADASQNSRQLRTTIEQLIAAQPDDQRLRDHIEGLTRDEHFPGLTWFWGPRLYARSRAIFRPFVLNHFSNWELGGRRRWRRIDWSEHEAELEAWLKQVRANRDTRLVRQILGWKYAAERWGVDRKRWCAALLADFKGAPTPAARAIVLDEYDDWFELDEASASALYQTDIAATDFILKHLPHFFWSDRKREMWGSLGNLARGRGDDKLFFSLYRALMPIDRWSAEVAALGDAVADPAELCSELEQRHPQGYGLTLAPTIVKLLKSRGRDVIPYVRLKLKDLVGGWRAEGAEALIDLAAKKGWWDLWAAALRTNSNAKLYGEAIGKLLEDASIGENDRIERLRALAGVSQEWNWPAFGLAIVHSLDDDLAARLYARYPDLVHGPFLAQVTPRWWNGYPKLLAAAQKQDDRELVDIIASRYATRFRFRYFNNKQTDELLKTAKTLARYYQALREKDPAAFALRASNVLTRIPAYAACNYEELLRTNELARLLFVRSFEGFLGVPRAVRDLVEGSSIYVQMLAYRVLAADDDRARALAVENLDILLGTLLRPIHRKTRLPAFDALANAARADETAARRILDRARDALRLPDKRYPKAELVGLIARILQAHPGLRDAAEQPVVYGRGAKAA